MLRTSFSMNFPPISKIRIAQHRELLKADSNSVKVAVLAA